MQPIPLRIGPDRCLYHIPPSALRGRPARPPVRARLLDIRNFNILFGNFILGRTVHIEMCNIVLIPSLNSCGHPSSCRNFHPIENRPKTKKLTKNGLLTPLPVFAPETAYPRNVIYDEYRFIPLRRRKFEVIRVVGRDFRGHQSWEDRDLDLIC